MTRIIGIFDQLAEAQAAARLLAANGLEKDCLSIIGQDSKSRPQSQLKQSAVWGSALGAAVALMLPHGGILYLAGHLARTAALHLLGMTVKGLAIGAAAGSGMEVLRRSGLDRRTAHQAAGIIKMGRFALALNGDWVTVQRARFALGESRTEDDAYLIEMVRRYGYEYQSFLSLYGWMEVWSSLRPEAAVVYRRVGRVAVVVAAPLTRSENMAETIRRFLDFCNEQKLACVMLPIGAKNADLARSCGMGILPIGESGYFELPAWKPAGDRCKKVRAGANQARRAGVKVERYDPQTAPGAGLRAEIEVLCQEWISTRQMDALGWLLELDPFKLSEYKRYFVARTLGGRIEGLLACCPIPARQGWYLEDLIRRPDAKRGVSELLVMEALKDLAAEGAKLATLGTSPLAGIEPKGDLKNLARLLKLVYEHLSAFYHFKGLHRFKSKFAPSFVDSEYVAFYPPRIRLRMVLAVISAFDPGGLSKAMATKLRLLWRKRRKPNET